MRPDLIREFLANPDQFLRLSEQDRKIWIVGLEEIVLPGIDQANTSPLRDKQVDAYRGFSENQCALLLGPPGTGKTTLLAWMALGFLLAKKRKGESCRILVTAFTRNAIFNILESVSRNAQTLGENIKIVFVGGDSGDTVGEGFEHLSRRNLNRALQEDYAIVGMTTWTVFRALSEGNHGGEPCFYAELFDILCIDEASQMKVGQGLMALAPLKDNARIVVSGDDRQLQPIGTVDDWGVDDRRIGGSLYSFLASSGIPVFQLSETFRLNEPLAKPPAEFFYDEYIAAESVADRRLGLRSGWQSGLPPWLQVALDPEYPVCILLHDGPPAATRSPFETALVGELVEALAPRIVDDNSHSYGSRLWAEGLAVVTPHRAQNASIRHRLRQGLYGEDCTVETVERMQGRERDAIVVSYTVADTEFAQIEGSFLFSPQRLNVAITRPRSKLILLISRRLLEVLPPDEEVFDSVQFIREYVFGSEHFDYFEHEALGYPVRVDIMLRRFDDTTPLPKIDSLTLATEPMPEFTAELEELEKAIQNLASVNEQYGSAASFEVECKVARQVPFLDYRDLFRLGRIVIVQRQGHHGLFWTFFPCQEHIIPLPCNIETVSSNLRAVVEECRQGSYPANYEASRYGRGVRDRFLWCGTNGEDRLRSILNQLCDEGEVLLNINQYGYLSVDIPPTEEESALPTPPTDELNDDDFRLLNLLEDLEVRRIDLGVFESWVTLRELREVCGDGSLLVGYYRNIRAILQALERLESHGYLIFREGRVRSRMAELAREIRYVKQRFRAGDQDSRPFLVRSLKVLAITRDKPVRDIPLSNITEVLIKRWRTDQNIPDALRAMAVALQKGLRLQSDEIPMLSAFQNRTFESLLSAWFKKEAFKAMVVTADTGSGKTEATCLPIIAGSAVDRIRGIRGTRAVLVYPRIRLAINQASRLVRYAKILCEELGNVSVTIGLQIGDVPSSWEWARKNYDQSDNQSNELWQPHEEGGWRFPFFRCPECETLLRLLPGNPEGEADRLECTDKDCNWLFDGWVGSKLGLRRNPPAIFLPVTESLHQWLQDPKYGPIFGDHSSDFSPPRVVLADEIHLYTHIHGAQVGWSLRRLLARCHLNGESNPIAIGMSATLGDPKAIWSDLCGIRPEDVLHIKPTDEECLENCRGREYYYFIQPEVESRGRDIAGASTTIQSVMLFAHGMRRRRGGDGGYRGVVFFDSIDKLKRLHSDYLDAESNKRLAALRTRIYGSDPQNPTQLRMECCQEPETCTRFRTGECWFFAATDPYQIRADGRRQMPGEPLTVAPRPIFSGTTGRVERMIKDSDLLFATSSLEVGFDDPDMGFVYQHYAPANLASFIQRKGRGGRGMDDRPITGITLSIYSSRDSWYFRNPHRMIQAANFQIPINMKNISVRRGQVLSALLDFLSWHAARTGWSPSPTIPENVLNNANKFVMDTFGDGIFDDLEVNSLADLWSVVLQEVDQSQMRNRVPRDWREVIPGVPSRLFDSINIPLLKILERDEDIALALNECAPGRVSRRWGYGEAHWIPPNGCREPWYAEDMGKEKEFSLAPGLKEEDLLRLVPEELRLISDGRIHPKVARPIFLQPAVAGKFKGSDWNPEWKWDEERSCAVSLEDSGEGDIPIHHKSQGHLQGFVIAHEEVDPLVKSYMELAPFTDGNLYIYQHRKGSKLTGLRVTQVFWCSDAEIVLDTPKRDRAYHRQIFVDREDKNLIRLYGYGMQPEGIRLKLNSRCIDAFLENELVDLNGDSARSHWHKGQFIRYLVMTKTGRVGLNRFEARQLADLLTTTIGPEDLRNQLLRGFKRSNPERLREAISEAWCRYLSVHPKLTERRLNKLLDRLDTPELIEVLKQIWEEVQGIDPFRGYLRSVLLHSLLIRLRQLFVIFGRSDDRSVLTHARLPVQFGTDNDDILTICERGSGGDGTTRAFLETAPELFRDWKNESFVSCPNAEADRILEMAFSRSSDHERWRSMDPRNPEWVSTLASELELENLEDIGPLQVVLRMLYDGEEIEGKRFEMFDLYREARSVRLALANEMNREPTDWELISSIVRKARDGDLDVAFWSALRASYGDLEEVLDEGTLSPDGRLADQVYRISSHLCFDGCQGCLHTGSDQMDDQLLEACTSRTFLQRFGSFIKS